MVEPYITNMTFLTALACHFIGDFPFQPDFMAKLKGENWEINLYHALTYTAVFILFGATSFQALILFVSHFWIDPLKARWKIIKTIWEDQLLHLIILAVLFL